MAGYIKRHIEKAVREAIADYPVVALLGARQVGKSTLAKKLSVKGKVYLDLELESDLNKLNEPELFFEQNDSAFICLDEIQHAPEIFQTMRGVVDKRNRNKQFLILGSASRDLIRQSSESLAGRICYLEMPPFTVTEVGHKKLMQLWVRGGFPRSFLSTNDKKSFVWRSNYIRTYLERDIPQLGFNIPAKTMQRLWTMLAHCHGQNLNTAKIAGSLGVSSHHKLRSYIDLLEQTFLIQTLKPFHPNIKKQYIKSPKVYIRDTGLLHTLLGIETANDLLGHHICGASFEGFVIENVIGAFPEWSFSYYRTKSSAEIDLVMSKGNRIVAVEIKCSKSPVPARGFWSAVKDIEATEKFLIAPVDTPYEIKNNVTVCPLHSFLQSFA